MSYGKEIYDNFINYCKEINMVNWIYELEWNCDGNLLFYIQNEGEGIALLWQCECQHSAAIYVLNHSFLYKWGNKAKEKRNELNEFVKNFMEDREIPDENFNICYDKNVCKYYEDFRLEQKPFDLLEYSYNMYGMETNGLKETIDKRWNHLIQREKKQA